MRGDLTVRIDDGTTDRHVTRHVRDLSFTKTAPGGHHSASMRVALPHDTFRDLGPADRVYIYDARTGATVWEGYTENPGVTDGPLGQEYDLSAMGGVALASDRSEALLYVDGSFDRWKRGVNINIAASSTTDASTNPSTGAGALLMQFNPGQPVTTGSFAELIYDVRDLGLTLGAISLDFQSGLDAVDWQFRFTFQAVGSWVEWSASKVARTSKRVVMTDFPTLAPPGFALIRMHRAGGATNVATDDVWTAATAAVVRGQGWDRNGARVLPIDTRYVLAHEVVEDLLGRLLPMCDPMTATIGTTTFQIDQLAYLDGARAADVLEGLSLYEPDFLWEVLESGVNGKHRFNYRPWPKTSRYEISVRDGFEASGGEADLCNRIAVYWTDAQGRKQVTVRNAVVPELGSRTRDAEPITLPDGLGSATNAARIGDQMLATKATPPKAARALVARPVVDRNTGIEVAPWEIEPGYLVRVRETGDELRLTEMTYTDADGAANLTLGEPVLTLEQRIARLSRKA